MGGAGQAVKKGLKRVPNQVLLGRRIAPAPGRHRACGGLNLAEHRIARTHVSICSACKTGDFARGRRDAISISRAALPPRRSHSRSASRANSYPTSPRRFRRGLNAVRLMGLEQIDVPVPLGEDYRPGMGSPLGRVSLVVVTSRHSPRTVITRPTRPSPCTSKLAVTPSFLASVGGIFGYRDGSTVHPAQASPAVACS